MATNTSPASVPPTNAAAVTAPHLSGRWLVLARIGWVAAVLGAVAFYADTLPSYYAYLRAVTPAAACNGCLQLSPADVSTLHQLGLTVDAYAWYVFASKLLILLGYGAVGAVLFWRASADRVGLVASLALVLVAIEFYVPLGGLVPGWPLFPEEVLGFLGAVYLGLFLCIFPSGRLVPRWSLWLLLAWSVYNAYDVFSLSFPDAPLVRTPPDAAIWACLAIGLVGAQVYRYWRVSTPVQRQQTKWAVLGVALGAGGFITAFLAAAIMAAVFSLSSLAEYVVYVAGTLLSLLIPLGIGIAVLRYRLFDVDVIIRRTLVYGSLTATLGAVYFGLVLTAQILGERLVGVTQPPDWVIVLTTLLVSALLVPLKRRLQALIDRRFYRARYDAARTLQAFAASLRTETDLRALSDDLLEVVQATLQPAHVSLWLRESGKMPRNQRTVSREGTGVR